MSKGNVIYSPEYGTSKRPIGTCCDSPGKVTLVRAFVPETGMTGYVVETAECDCRPRWVAHDWKSHGHLVAADLATFFGSTSVPRNATQRRRYAERMSC